MGYCSTRIYLSLLFFLSSLFRPSRKGDTIQRGGRGGLGASYVVFLMRVFVYCGVEDLFSLVMHKSNWQIRPHFGKSTLSSPIRYKITGLKSPQQQSFRQCYRQGGRNSCTSVKNCEKIEYTERQEAYDQLEQTFKTYRTTKDQLSI